MARANESGVQGWACSVKEVVRECIRSSIIPGSAVTGLAAVLQIERALNLRAAQPDTVSTGFCRMRAARRYGKTGPAQDRSPDAGYRMEAQAVFGVIYPRIIGVTEGQRAINDIVALAYMVKQRDWIPVQALGRTQPAEMKQVFERLSGQWISSTSPFP